jgi:hypothetical protein
MYVCNDAKKMVIQFNSNDETEMPVHRTSDFGLPYLPDRQVTCLK